MSPLCTLFSTKEKEMFYPKLLWNPINLVEGEGRWIALELAIILGALLSTKVLEVALKKLSKRIKNVYFDIVAASLYSPVVYLLWCSTALLSFDLVTDGFLSESHSSGWALAFNFAILSAFGWFLFRLKNQFVQYAIEVRTKISPSNEAFPILALSKLFTILIIVIILVLFHDITGMSLTTLLAFGGVGGLAIAFASQEIISNFFGGLMLHITRPFTIGERIFFPSNNIDGYIEEIGWYQTRIRAINKTAVYLPNALFTKALLINKSRATHRPLDVTLYVDAPDTTALHGILESLTKYIQEHPKIDHRYWSGPRLDSVGPTSSILISASTTTLTDEAFYKLHDTITLDVAHIIETHKGRLAQGPQFILSTT